MKNWIILGVILIVIAGSLYFTTGNEQVSSQTILETNTTIIGQEIEYPSGKAW